MNKGRGTKVLGASRREDKLANVTAGGKEPEYRSPQRHRDRGDQLTQSESNPEGTTYSTVPK